MKLESHGRYDYSAITERKDYSWPGGTRLAVHFCLNVEHSPSARAWATTTTCPTRCSSTARATTIARG